MVRSLMVGNLLLLMLAPFMPLVGLAQTRPSNATQFKSLAEQAARASSENHLDEAVALYTKALALRPRWTDGWWSLGTIEYDQDHYAKAARDFEKLIALDGRNGTAHAMLGLCQFELGRDSLALKNLLAAEELGIDLHAQRTVELHERYGFTAFKLSPFRSDASEHAASNHARLFRAETDCGEISKAFL